METIHQPVTLTTLFAKMINNITSTQVYEKLKSDLIEIHTIEHQEKTRKSIPQKQKQTLPLKHQQKIAETSFQKNEHISEKLEYQIESPQTYTDKKEGREVQSTNRKNHINQQNTTQQRQIKFIPLSYPTTYTAPNHYTQHMKEDLVEAKPNIRLSSEEQSINLQLTQKTKQTKNLSHTLAKQDSLIYSDATLMYSNATGFAAQSSQHVGLHKIQRAQSHKSVLRKIEDSDQNQIGAKIERAVSREVQRGHRNTDQTSHEEQFHTNIKSQPKEESAIFQTEIADYKNKIAKIRQIKEKKKKLLESQLNKVNREIDELARKQSESPNVKNNNNNYESRVKIAENTVAKAKAERLVRGLQREKKARFQAHLDEMQAIDKNINNYMQELMKQRYKNEERIKQKKKLQIIERMKQQEMRKIEQQKQKDLNIKFVNKLKESNSKQHIQTRIQPRPVVQSQNQNVKQDLVKKNEVINKQRSPTRKSQIAQQSEITPELSRKKAFLRKIRNISFKKEKADAYEQVLM